MSSACIPPPSKKALMDHGKGQDQSGVVTSSGSTAAASAAAVIPVTRPEFRKSDEVAIIRNGKLVFGILEYQIKDKPGEWSVRWNTSDFNGLSYKCPLITVEPQIGLTFTDRALYKGCKVRSTNPSNHLVGVCRDVMMNADLRVVGTTTVIPSINIDLFKHLKEYKQKSVVYKSGWLGVITDVKRTAKIRLQSGPSRDITLNELVPIGASQAEAPWINEELNGRGIRFTKIKGSDELSPSTQTIFIENLQVDLVKVVWRYQVDAMRPDRPPAEIKGDRLKDLQIVMEELSSETTFQVGNLGRFKIEAQTEFQSMEEFSRKFVADNLGSAVVDKLDRPFKKPLMAYDDNPEERLAPEKSCVVEILRTSTVGDIIWQNGEMEFVSGKNLIIQDGSLLDNVLAPGDFLYSTELANYGTPGQIYAVVSRYDLSNKTVTVKVLSIETENSPKLRQANVCLRENSVVPHPRYKYFNQVNTVVVTSRDGCTWVGHVRRSNPEGKVQVLWLHSKKEEWIWPTECSVYSVKGHDLECIVSLINDEDETKEVDSKTKFLHLVKKLNSINGIWNEVAEVETSDNLSKLRKQSLVDLRNILSECCEIEEQVSKDDKLFSSDAVSKSSEEIGNLIDQNKGDSDGQVTYTDLTLVQSMVKLCSTLLHASDELMTKYFDKKSEVRTLSSTEAMDTLPIPTSATAEIRVASIPESATDCTSSQCLIPSSCGHSEFSIFEPNVVIEDAHPEGHHYSTKSEFQPRQLANFIKVVKNELNNLRDQCPPEIKIKAFGTRFDLFSILIGGPTNTPYENSIYLFDAVLPGDYPSVPPKFHFHSYLAGRLNPNLYAEGKVCVSLLGTWSGTSLEKWCKDSTIVQVLLSIQALILVKEPYHNEPGQEVDKYTTAVAQTHCHTYNIALIPKVMVMMMNQIKRPMDPWKAETTAYYQKSLPLFIKRWESWLAAASKSRTREAFEKKLGDNKPGFEIYPITNSAIIKDHLSSLRKLHTELMKGNDNDNDADNADLDTTAVEESSTQAEFDKEDEEEDGEEEDEEDNSDNEESAMEVDS